MSTSIEQRLDELEAKTAFQDHTIDELNAVITRQDARISQLERMLKLMAERLKEHNERLDRVDHSAPRPEDEIPPHY